MAKKASKPKAKKQAAKKAAKKKAKPKKIGAPQPGAGTADFAGARSLSDEERAKRAANADAHIAARGVHQERDLSPKGGAQPASGIDAAVRVEDETFSVSSADFSEEAAGGRISPAGKPPGGDGVLDNLPPGLREMVAKEYAAELEKLRGENADLKLVQAALAKEKHFAEAQLDVIYKNLPRYSERVRRELSNFERGIDNWEEEKENGSIERTISIFRNVMQNFSKRSPSAVAAGKSADYEGMSFLDDMETLERAASKGIDTAIALWAKKYDGLIKRVNERFEANKKSDDDMIVGINYQVAMEEDGLSQVTVELRGASYSFLQAFGMLKGYLLAAKEAKEIETKRLQAALAQKQGEALAKADLEVGESTPQMMTQAQLEKAVAMAVPQETAMQIKEIIDAMKRAPYCVSYNSRVISKGTTSTRFVHKDDFHKEYHLLYTAEGIAAARNFDIQAHRDALPPDIGEVEIDGLKAKLTPEQWDSLVKSIPMTLKRNKELEDRAVADAEKIHDDTETIGDYDLRISDLEKRLKLFNEQAEELTEVKKKRSSLDLDLAHKTRELDEEKANNKKAKAAAIGAAEKAKDTEYKAKIKGIEDAHAEKLAALEVTNKELRARAAEKKGKKAGFEHDPKDTKEYKLGKADAEAEARKKYTKYDKEIAGLKVERDAKEGEMSKLEELLEAANAGLEAAVRQSETDEAEKEKLRQNRDEIQEDLDELRRQQNHFLEVTFPQRLAEFKKKYDAKQKKRARKLAKRYGNSRARAAQDAAQLAMRDAILSGGHPCYATMAELNGALDAEKRLGKERGKRLAKIYGRIHGRYRESEGRKAAQLAMRDSILSGGHICFTSIPTMHTAVDDALTDFKKRIFDGSYPYAVSAKKNYDDLQNNTERWKRVAKKYAAMRVNPVLEKLAAVESELEEEREDLWFEIEGLCYDNADLERELIHEREVIAPENARQRARRLARRYGAGIRKDYDKKAREANERLDNLYMEEKEKRRIEFIDAIRGATATARLRQYIQDSHAADERMSELEQELADEKAKPRQPAGPDASPAKGKGRPGAPKGGSGRDGRDGTDGQPGMPWQPEAGNVYNFYGTGPDGEPVSPKNPVTPGPRGRPGMNYSWGWRPWTPDQAADEMNKFYTAGPSSTHSSTSGLNAKLSQSSASSRTGSAGVSDEEMFYAAQWEREDRHYASALGMLMHLGESGSFKRVDLIACETGTNLLLAGKLNEAQGVFEVLLNLESASDEAKAVASNNLGYILEKKGDKRAKDFAAVKVEEGGPFVAYKMPRPEDAVAVTSPESN